MLALGVWLAGWGPAAAAGTSLHDVDTTRSYLRTEVAFFRTVVVNSHLGVRAGDELVGHIAKACPGVGSGAPRSAASEEVVEKMREETLDALVLAVVSPDLAAERHVAVALARLRWSSRKLTDLVHRRARIESATSALALPDLCGDLKEWAASGHVTEPAGTRRFLEQYAATAGGGGDLQERIQPMLKSYEGARERVLARHLEKLITRAVHLLGTALDPLVGRVAVGLGFVNPGGRPTRALIQPPPEVAQEGGRRLEEFELGRTVAAQSGCLACHRIGEDGNRGPGPELTHVGSRLPGTAIARALIDPKAPMPSFRNLPKKKFEALVEFLSLLH